jgi:UDP-N-acetylmuramate--alanine ligase
VSGTAGKTTTSALLALIMSRCGRDPSIIVGGAIHQLDTGVRWRRDSGWLVVEADESDGSFLRFGAEHVVITNIQPDHLDLWGTMAELEAGFDRFAGQAVEQRGTVRLGIDDAGSRALLGRLGREHGSVPAGLASYGFAEDADYRIVGFTSDGLRSKAEVLLDGEPLCHLRLAVPGRHNAANATAALASAHGMGVDLAAAAAAIEDFRGVARRFELRGEAGGVRFFDDYAHLPMKIAAAVEAGRLATGPGGRLVVVFQPHRYTRTRDLGPELAAALEGADVIVVTGIYAAGQDPIPGITGEHVAEQARAANPGIPVHHVEERGRVAEVVADLLQPGDVCVTLNAGDLVTLPDELMAALG